MINTAEFRKKIEDYIAEQERLNAERLATWEKAVEAHQQEWLDNWGELWRKSALLISRTVKSGKVVTSDMIPKRPGSYSNDIWWSRPHRIDGMERPQAKYVPPRELTQVLDALALVNEPEISHTALAKVGINSSIMSVVSAHLAGRYR